MVFACTKEIDSDTGATAEISSLEADGRVE